MKHSDYIKNLTRNSTSKIEAAEWYSYPSGDYINTVSDVLHVLRKYTDSSITDPDRSKIDQLYEDRFSEFAAKRKIITTDSRDKSKSLKLNINKMFDVSGPGVLHVSVDDPVFDDEAEAGDVIGAEEDRQIDSSPTITDLANGIGLVDSDEPELFDNENEGDGNFENE